MKRKINKIKINLFKVLEENEYLDKSNEEAALNKINFNNENYKLLRINKKKRIAPLKK